MKNDNYFKLITGEIPIDFQSKSKLKVYKGTTLVSEQGIPGIPSAVETLYSDELEPKIPIIAVSIGASVLFYRNMKPYYKYTLSGLDVESLEMDIWRKLPVERPEKIESLICQLKTIEMSVMTPISQKLINLDEEERQDFIRENSEELLQKVPTITAMTTLKRTSNDIKAASCLVIATDAGDILILDSQSFTILHTAKVCSFRGTPTLISSSGQFDVDFKIVVSTREGSLCLIRKTWLEGRQITKLEQPATGLALLPIDQTIVVVCMNSSLLCFSKKGKKLWSVRLPASAMCMVPVQLPHLGVTLVCVALKGGIVQLYSQKNLVDQFTMPETISAMTFGRLGQEDHVLVLITTDGSLIVKILKRTAVFSTTEITKLPDSTDSHLSLEIPKKTKVFVEQTTRERENAKAIHNSFQSELWRLRLTAARATVDCINTAESTISGDLGNVPVKLAAEIIGLGPTFRLDLTLENMSTRKEASNLSVLLHADHRHYRLKRPFTRVCLYSKVYEKTFYKLFMHNFILVANNCSWRTD